MNDLVMKVRNYMWWLLPLALLLVLLALETDFGRGVFLHPAPEGPIVAKPVVVSLMPDYTIDGSKGPYTETVSRTLFNPTRRPAPVAPAEPPRQRMQRGQFALTGTTLAGERNLAFLREVNGGKARTVRKGDTINGMLVAEVKPDRVRLTLDGESEELVLKVIANPKATPQPAAPPPAVAGQPALGLPGQGVAAHVPPPATQAQPAAGQEPPGQTLAERRRAARAAEAAARAQAEAAEAAGSAAPPTMQPQAAGSPGQPDTGWAAVYQRYQQRAAPH